MAVTVGRPSVRVPVLSTTTWVRREALCRASLLRMSTLAWAARLVPTMMAIGVARPRAQGQAMTSTAMAVVRAKASRGSGPMNSHQANEAAAMRITIGTNTPAIRSTSRPMGGLDIWAERTMRMMRASVVSSPSRLTRRTKAPERFMVPPVTASPSSRATASGSPVSMDSSMVVRPSVITPSMGTFSPGRTRTRSPTRNSDTGISAWPAARTTRAVVARRPISALIASLVVRLARVSRAWPSWRKARIITEASRYR